MINAYMVDNVTIHAYNGADQWGEPVAATQRKVKAYVVFETRMVRTLTGEDAVSPVHVYLHLRNVEKTVGRALQHQDRIEIEGDGNIRPIMHIATKKAFSSPHYEVDLA